MSILTGADSLYISDKEICEALEISQPTLWRRPKITTFRNPLFEVEELEKPC